MKSRGLGDVYKRQWQNYQISPSAQYLSGITGAVDGIKSIMRNTTCLLYTSDAADDLLTV